MYYILRRSSNQLNYDGFDFDVFAGRCLNRSYFDSVTSVNQSKYADASIIVNVFAQNQLFIPRSMGNPVLSDDVLSRISSLAQLEVKPVSVHGAYSLDCPTGMDLDDFLNPGEDSSVLHERLLKKYSCPIPERAFFELLCFHRPSNHLDLCNGSDVVNFVSAENELDKAVEIPTALVDHFGLVKFGGLFFRDDVFDVIREHINEDVFTIQHG